ncbi:hypothetical protein DPMN_010895 [Dreissena polymorpha]|uniref:Uncharacterized protein n=1 Tax=Dreissena polymorpha TaxID=45954 RepID=A0A9D4MZJ2_DREPO|nr:hypothetical protein DPMN_010895 [Dreissena polymorpha]
MQHISKTLCKDSTEVKQLNLYKKGQVTPGGMTLNYCSIASLFTQLEDSAEFSTRMKAVKMFNQVISIVELQTTFELLDIYCHDVNTGLAFTSN